MASLSTSKEDAPLDNLRHLCNPFLQRRPPLTSEPITMQQVLGLMGKRIGKLEELLNENMKAVEQKFGQQDNYIVENLPDTDAINVAFEDINQRLLKMKFEIKFFYRIRIWRRFRKNASIRRKSRF